VGWAFGGRWGVERYIYTLHRITGLALLFYLLLHILVTSSRLFGKEIWELVMGFVDNSFFHFGEFLVFCAFCFHAFNGVRLILIELGFATGKPEEPVYPYRSSLHKQKPLLIVSLVLASVLILLGAYDFLHLNDF
jgi:succinate dehydrogenase / fumarate reductase cytochrome b subunit